ncbi:hypothetical protein [Methanoculleus sp. 10]|uniref:hypothetical protein n=1 Tax=Methanoculleus sp. 10 TaxID=430615 RepID=UPI0025E5E795|nr:hypothetical protein [Methanoculleus sp. 10]
MEAQDEEFEARIPGAGGLASGKAGEEEDLDGECRGRQGRRRVGVIVRVLGGGEVPTLDLQYLLETAQRSVTLDLFNTFGVIFLNQPLLEMIIFIFRAGKY